MNSETTKLVTTVANSNDASGVVAVNNDTNKKRSINITNTESSTSASKKIKVVHDGVHDCAVTPILILRIYKMIGFLQVCGYVKQHGELSRAEKFLLQLLNRMSPEDKDSYEANPMRLIALYAYFETEHQPMDTDDMTEIEVILNDLACKYDADYQIDTPYDIEDLNGWTEIENDKITFFTQQHHCHVYFYVA